MCTLHIENVSSGTCNNYFIQQKMAQKWAKYYFLEKSTKLAGIVEKGLRRNIFNGFKMAFHYFVFCAPC